jgi:TRAP-type mannitol/chloroaromatic compound transport system substrate-binding protein
LEGVIEMTKINTNTCKRLSIIFAFMMLWGCRMDQFSSDDITILKLQSWAGKDERTYIAAKKFSETVKKATDGKLIIEIFASGSEIPAKTEFEGVISGQIDMVHIPPGWTTDYLISADFFSNWVNGLTPNQLEMWMKIEGQEIAQRLYDKFGVHFVGILTLSPPEVWAHSTKQLKSVDDIKGLSIRLGGGDTIAIFQKMGASPVLLPGGDIYGSAKEGKIEAFEYINPSVNFQMKFYEVAKYMYLDSSRSPCDTQILLVNNAVWNKLPKSFQEIISLANDKIAKEFYAESVLLDIEAVENFKKQGTIVSKLPDDIKELLNDKAKEYFDEEAKKDEDFKVLYDKIQKWKKTCEQLGIK